VPWLLFVVLVACSQDARLAAGTALGVAVVFVLCALARRRAVRIMDVAAAGIFTGLAVVTLATGRPGRQWVVEYGPTVSTLLLAVVMVLSAGRLPFTEQIAREELPRQYWASPLLRGVHARITVGWSGLVAIIAVALLFGAWTDDETPLLAVLLNWVAPAALLLTATAQHLHLARRSTRSDRHRPLHHDIDGSRTS